MEFILADLDDFDWTFVDTDEDEPEEEPELHVDAFDTKNESLNKTAKLLKEVITNTIRGQYGQKKLYN